MAEKVIQFPGKFHASNENESREPKDDRPLAEVVDISPNEESQDSKVLSFLETMNTIRDTDRSILWLGNSARKMDIKVREYSDKELISWAAEATNMKIKSKPLF